MSESIDNYQLTTDNFHRTNNFQFLIFPALRDLAKRENFDSILKLEF